MQREAMQAAIRRAFPELTDCEFTILSMGWDCLAIDAGDRLLFKFPRHAAAERRLRREAGVLSIIRPAVTIPVPDLTLHEGPPLFSCHEKLRGEHLVTRDYDRLTETARAALASDMAGFYAELHHLDPGRLDAAGAGGIEQWLAPDEILRRACPALPGELAAYARRAIADWQALPPDPYGTVFGYFDGHGWNMAFDHSGQRLNGLYDFGDSGFGPLHQDFIYSNFISPDLTARIIMQYEALTGRRIDHRRIDLLTAIHRLSELADHAEDDRHAPAMVELVSEWARHHLLQGYDAQ